MNPRHLERTLFIIKPDAAPVANLILARVLSKGFDFVHLTRAVPLPDEVWQGHYAEHKGKDFFTRLIHFQTSGPNTVVCVEGINVIDTLRKKVGPTQIADAPVGTIRGDYRHFAQAGNPASTLVHASDSLASARREIIFWQQILGWSE